MTNIVLAIIPHNEYPSSEKAYILMFLSDSVWNKYYDCISIEYYEYSDGIETHTLQGSIPKDKIIEII